MGRRSEESVIRGKEVPGGSFHVELTELIFCLEKDMLSAFALS